MAQQTHDLPPFEDWDPTVIRWVENAAVFDLDSHSRLLAAVLIDDTPWGTAAAARMTEAARISILDSTCSLIGWSSSKASKQAPADSEAKSKGPLFSQEIREAFEVWRSDKIPGPDRIVDFVHALDIADLLYQSSQVSGGRVTPWPLACLVADRYVSGIDPAELWSSPVIVRTEHAIRFQRSVDVEQARVIAMGTDHGYHKDNRGLSPILFYFSAYFIVVEIRLALLPRFAGVTSPRQRWFGPGRAGQYTMVSSQVDAGFRDQPFLSLTALSLLTLRLLD